MIYFLYGLDTYRSRKRLGEIIAEFGKKTGAGFSVTRVDAEEYPDAVLAVGRTASLFSAKELVVIENITRCGEHYQSHIRTELEAWQSSRDLTVIFWEAGLGTSQGSMADAITARAVKVQEFKPLAPIPLGRWIDEEARARGFALSPAEKRRLMEQSGGDLWLIANELAKIQDGWSLSASAREAQNIFAFSDAFLEGGRRSFVALMRLLASGQEPIYLLAMLAGSLRSLALVWWGLETGKLKTATRSLHPFVVKKNSERARRLSPEKLRAMYRDLIATDLGLKTGRLPSPLPMIELALRRD